MHMCHFSAPTENSGHKTAGLLWWLRRLSELLSGLEEAKPD